MKKFSMLSDRAINYLLLFLCFIISTSVQSLSPTSIKIDLQDVKIDTFNIKDFNKMSINSLNVNTGKQAWSNKILTTTGAGNCLCLVLIDTVTGYNFLGHYAFVNSIFETHNGFNDLLKTITRKGVRPYRAYIFGGTTVNLSLSRKASIDLTKKLESLNIKTMNLMPIHKDIIMSALAVDKNIIKVCYQYFSKMKLQRDFREEFLGKLSLENIILLSPSFQTAKNLHSNA